MGHLFQILFSVIVGTVALYISSVYLLPPSSDVVWIETILAKKRWAAELMAKDGPRIFIAGGSEGHYSISAEQIERETGLPTVNFASHAGLGVGGHLHVIANQLRPGDIVIYSANYYTLVASEPTAMQAEFMRRNAPTFWIRQSPASWPHLLGNNVLDQVIRALPTVPNRASAVEYGVRLNANGDENRFADGSKAVLGRPAGLVPSVVQTPDSIRQLAVFERSWARRGVRTFIFWPAVRERLEYRRVGQQQRMARFSSFAQSWGLSELNKPYEILLADSEVADTPFHTTPKGRERVTTDLIERLTSYLQAS